MFNSQRPRSIVITGASAGLGAALALAYGRSGVVLGLLARNRDRLDAVAAQCRANGATVVVGCIDVADRAGLANFISAFDAENPIELLIANAGVFTGHGPDRVMESLDEVSAMLRTNLEGVANTIAAALPMLRRRRAGRIAIIGSLAALQPLADAPAYSASKAAVISYGEALREFLVDDAVAVSLVYPGHIATAQTACQVGPLDLMMSPEQAAGIIKRGLDRGRTSIAFPLRLLALIYAGRMLHWRVRALFGRGFRFHVAKSDAGERPL